MPSSARTTDGPTKPETSTAAPKTFPMVPLARALIDAGHAVACASGAVVGEQAAGLGLQHFLAGPDQMSAAERTVVFPEIERLTPAEIRPFFFARVFADYELALRAPDIGRIVDDWAPDLLIHEVAELAGPLVATTHHVAYATHSYGVVLGDDGVRAAAEGARPHWMAAGVPPHARAGLWEHLLHRHLPSIAPARVTGGCAGRATHPAGKQD